MSEAEGGQQRKRTAAAFFSPAARAVRNARVTVISRHEHAKPSSGSHFQLTKTESRGDGDRLAGGLHRPARIRHRASGDAAPGGTLSHWPRAGGHGHGGRDSLLGLRAYAV